MILNYVANGACFFVKSAPALNPKILRHGDLYAFHMAAIPERLQDRVGKTQKQHVMNRPLSEVMINAKDSTFIEGTQENAIKFHGRGEIPAKRLFDNYPSTLSAT